MRQIFFNLIILIIYSVVIDISYGQDSPCAGLMSGIYINHPENCSVFYICLNERLPVEIECGHNMRFNELEQGCVEDEDGQCADGYCSGQENGNYLPHNECNKYVVCNDGLVTIQTCPDGFRFYNNIGGSPCYLDDGTCYGPKETTISSASSSSSLPMVSICDGQLNEAILPHENSCNKFYICINGIATEHTCSKGLRFQPAVGCVIDDGSCHLDVTTDIVSTIKPTTLTTNSELGSETTKLTPAEESICTNKIDGTVLSHKFCNQYYLCQNGNPIEKICENGKRFDNERLLCVLDSNNVCQLSLPTTQSPSDICQNQLNGILMEHENCNYFYICFTGMGFAQSCGTRHFFNPIEKKCVKDINGICPTVHITF